MVYLVRKKLTPDELAPPNLRWNSDCDCIQQTPDGGTTWVDVPAADPRIGPGFRKPPNSTDDPQCNAAANMVAGLRSFIALDIEAVSTWQLCSAFAAIFIAIFPVGLLIDLLLAAATIILDIGQSNVEAAFTEDVYDGLRCIFYCNIDADGQMSDAQLSDIYDAVATQFGGTVQAVFGAHSSGLGPNGWSNIGATGTITDADCSACDCGPWEIDLDFTLHPYTFLDVENVWINAALVGTTAVWVDGLGYGHDPAGDPNHTRIAYIQATFVNGDGSQNAFLVTSCRLIATELPEYVTTQTFLQTDGTTINATNDPGAPSVDQVLEYAGADFTAYITALEQNTPGSGADYTGYITHMIISGTGTKPNVDYP